MPTNHNHATTSRTAKRKAESSPQEEDPPTTQSRPQRKKQKQQPTKQEEDTSPSASPVATTKTGGNESALTKHLLGLFNEIKKTVDDEYVSMSWIFVFGLMVRRVGDERLRQILRRCRIGRDIQTTLS